MHIGCKQWIRVGIGVICAQHLIKFYHWLEENHLRLIIATDKYKVRTSLTFHKRSAVIASSSGESVNTPNGPAAFHCAYSSGQNQKCQTWPRFSSCKFGQSDARGFINVDLSLFSFGEEFRKLDEGVLSQSSYWFVQMYERQLASGWFGKAYPRALRITGMFLSC